LSLYEYRMIGMDLVSVFCRQKTSFPRNICWRDHLFLIICFWNICWKKSGHSYMNSHPGHLLCSTGLHICFYASTMLFSLLWLCNTVWSLVFWYLQRWSFYTVLSWLFMTFCVSKCTVGLIFQSLCWMSLGFWWEFHWTCRLLSVV
jgi:hypothetical protein